MRSQIADLNHVRGRLSVITRELETLYQVSFNDQFQLHIGTALTAAKNADGIAQGRIDEYEKRTTQ